MKNDIFLKNGEGHSHLEISSSLSFLSSYFFYWR